MTRRLSAFAALLALTLLGVSPVRAETAGFDLGLFRSGMPLADLRHAAWPAGARLLCSGDSDLPANMVSPPRDGIVLPQRLTDRGVIACALFSPNAEGAWALQTAEFAGGPAGVWVLAIAEKKGAAARLVQAKLFQPEDAFKATVAYVTGRLGPADFVNEHGARWSGVESETIIGHMSSGGISTILTDKRLEALVREQTGEGKPEAKSKPKP